MDGDSPYFDRKKLIGLGTPAADEPISNVPRRTQWDYQLDGFDSSESGGSKRVAVASTASAAALTSSLKEIARVLVAPEAARDWTVTLGQLSPGNARAPFQQTDSFYAPPNISDAVALIQWKGGQKGAPAWALVDWWAGQQFSVYGSSVRVSGAVLELATAAVAANNTHLLSAHIVPGKAQHQPRRTLRLPTIAPSQSASVAVPPFATNVTFSMASLTGFGGTDVSLFGELIDGGTQIWEQLPLSFGGASQGDGVKTRMPIGTNFIRVVNNDNNMSILQGRLLFDLALS